MTSSNNATSTPCLLFEFPFKLPLLLQLSAKLTNRNFPAQADETQNIPAQAYKLQLSGSNLRTATFRLKRHARHDRPSPFLSLMSTHPHGGIKQRCMQHQVDACSIKLMQNAGRWTRASLLHPSCAVDAKRRTLDPGETAQS